METYTIQQAYQKFNEFLSTYIAEPIESAVNQALANYTPSGIVGMISEFKNVNLGEKNIFIDKNDDRFSVQTSWFDIDITEMLGRRSTATLDDIVEKVIHEIDDKIADDASKTMDKVYDNISVRDLLKISNRPVKVVIEGNSFVKFEDRSALVSVKFGVGVIQ